MGKKSTERTEKNLATSGESLKKTSRSTSITPGKNSLRGSSRWTFLTNHAHVLIILHTQTDCVLREVALQVGITERAVQRIIQDLEDEGFIVREKVGRKNKYQVLTDQPLRHPIESHRQIGDLLNLMLEE